MTGTADGASNFGRKHNALFGPGPQWHLNACVGRNGGPSGFDRFARGYFEAGERLVQSLRDDSFGVDRVVYPFVLVYRHGAELALKHLTRTLSDLHDSSAEVKATHRLMDNWRVVRQHLSRLDVEKPLLKDVEAILDDFVEIDANGETFRYPEAKNGTRLLQETSLINIEVFAERMGRLANFLDQMCGWVDHLLDHKRDFEREMADYHGIPD